VSVHGTYIALEPSLDGEEPTAFKAVVLSFVLGFEAKNSSDHDHGATKFLKAETPVLITLWE